MPPNLDNIEELLTYILNNRPENLRDDELISEYRHWNTLCRARLWEESRRGAKSDNPISKANVVRLGGTGFGVLSLILHVVLPPIAIALGSVAVIIEIYNESVEFRGWRARKTVEKPIGIINQRCLALEQELDKRSRQR